MLSPAWAGAGWRTVRHGGPCCPRPAAGRGPARRPLPDAVKQVVGRFEPFALSRRSFFGSCPRAAGGGRRADPGRGAAPARRRWRLCSLWGVCVRGRLAGGWTRGRSAPAPRGKDGRPGVLHRARFPAGLALNSSYCLVSEGNYAASLLVSHHGKNRLRRSRRSRSDEEMEAAGAELLRLLNGGAWILLVVAVTGH